ncbi:unnamed protein product [Bursaphelenchus xylophilus]|uniref:(pine wood nematode) hypothetical protein n=1 Tax=Bursaphelenchus xylophilus TaxID=6326 RepID=A0A1I7RWJ7_BURXY|nr:unnamed protein product [Bursaphelenchus xylophilus]CAG9128434.1 unnamed protein product [Bursaphelenchus xylophilus]
MVRHYLHLKQLPIPELPSQCLEQVVGLSGLSNDPNIWVSPDYQKDILKKKKENKNQKSASSGCGGDCVPFHLGMSATVFGDPIV